MVDYASVSVNHLPNEILLKIFSYLSVEDLGLNVQFVCNRWCELCMHDVLWRDSLFTSAKNPSVQYIVSVLEKVPKLQCFSMVTPTVEVLHKLAECTKNLRKLVLAGYWQPEDCEEALQNLFTECRKLEEITIPSTIIANENLAAFVGQLPYLRYISLRGLPGHPITLKQLAEDVQFYSI